MARDHRAPVEPFGGRRAHVVGAHDLEHRASHEAAPDRDVEQAEHDRRQDQMFDAVAEIEVVARRDFGRRQREMIPKRRDPRDRERQLQHQREPERRHRLAEERERGHDVVDPRVGFDRGEDTDRDADHERDHKRGTGQEQGRRNALGDRLCDRFRVRSRVAEVAAQHHQQPVQVTHR